MKDFYDIWILTKTFDFEPDWLPRAIAATFARRRTAIPAGQPDALTSAFAEDPLKQRQWAAFAADLDGAREQLRVVIGDVANFLMRAAIAARE
jgi:Nucleotidyl transferase AbiEii toxin, Type IV TA system